MAQANEPKGANAAHEAPPQPDNDRNRTRAAASHISAGEQNMISAGATAAQNNTEIMRDSVHQTSDAMRHGGAAMAETTRTTIDAGADVGRRGADALAGAYYQLLEQTTDRFETIGRTVTQNAQEATSNLRSFMLSPEIASTALRDLQDTFSSLVSGVVQSNVQAAQELLRLTDPEAVINLQQRFMRDYLEAIMQGTNNLLRIAQQTSQEALQPIEAGSRNLRSRNGRSENNGVVSDVMSHKVSFATPEDSVQQATRLMREDDTGVLPVGENDRLVGIVTDRDVAMRLVAEGKDPARTKVRDVMTDAVKYVYEDEDLRHVADNMAEQQVSRLPVINRSKRVVGTISLGDLPQGRQAHSAAKPARGINRDSRRQVSDAAE